MRAEAGMSILPGSPEDRILCILERHVSPLTARGMLRVVLKELGMSPRGFLPSEMPRVIDALAPGIRMYVPERHQAHVKQELAKLVTGPKRRERIVLQIRTDADACRARALARSLCDDLGTRSLLRQRFATGVSELTRNILNYAGEGTIVLEVIEEKPRRLHAQSCDSGPGIPDLELVLSGRYQSKTGLGRGLCGVRAIADRFDIATSDAGTRVDFDVHL